MAESAAFDLAANIAGMLEAGAFSEVDWEVPHDGA
jgi:hypothetical protein